MKYAFALLLLVMVMPLWAQQDTGDKSAPVQGTLYVLVDQTATIYLNGAKVEMPKGEKSVPVTFRPGDRLVAKISSTHYYRHLALLFVSLDKQTMISFKRAAFKILPDPEATDFTVDQFNDITKGAILIDELMKHDYVVKIEKDNSFLFKNDSQFIWVDRQEGALGAVITSDMFSPMAP